MPKIRTPSLLRNLRIELVADNDDPTKFQVFVTYDLLDEEEGLLSQGRHEVILDGSKHSNAVGLIQEAMAAVMAEHELTEEDVQAGKDRAEERRQEREVEQERKRQEREDALQEAAQALRDQHAPLLEAEIEAALERIRMEHPVLPVVGTEFPTPPEIVEDVLQKALEEKERVRQEQEAAGEAYQRGEAERERNRREIDDESIRRQREAEGVPVPPATPPRRPQR